MDFKKYYELYRNTLEKEVMPFWLKYSLDESGAINNCLTEDGVVLSRDRYIWSQGRALWTFSALYNRMGGDMKYLERANGLFSYLKSIGANERGSWNYLYDGEGNKLEDDISIYVDGFVLCGMTEYYAATKNAEALDIALKIYDTTKRLLNTPGSYRVAPYVIPEGMKTHGVNMIFSFFYHNLAKVTGRSDIDETAEALAYEVLNKFYVEEKDAILEFVNCDGSFSDTPEGRACVPGHAIECMWFLITMFEENGDAASIEKCCRLIKRHFELAWDGERSGMFLALDIDGKEPCFWGKPTYKPWWVQLETLVATAYAYKHTRDEWFLETHEKVSEYAFAHYPSGSGDWHNWLDKDGNIGESAALPVKDPFHLPRALIYLCDLFGNQLPKLT